jgi:ABC-type multidrug transport system permease subunit
MTLGEISPAFKWIVWVWPYALTAIALIGLAYLIWAGRF